jgi:hypothetical protein
LVEPQCTVSVPSLAEVAADQQSACVRADDVRAEQVAA